MEFRIAKITLYVVILILGCVGNGLVAVVIIGAKYMRSPPNCLILNLALCDFITPALSIPFDLALEESEYVWPFGKVMCKVLWPLQTAFSTSSSITLAVISLERFKTLSKPFARRIGGYHVLLSVLAIHSLSISVCIPYFIVLNYNKPASSCDESWPDVGYRKAYTIVLFLFGYSIPLLIMSMAYLFIYRSLRSNLLRLTSQDFSEGRPRNISKAFQESTLGRDSMEHKRKEQNIRLAKMFIIVVVVFAISMFPNQVLWFWVDFENGGDNAYFHYISAVCRICTYANSVLNPFIYALKSKEFRSGFARIGRTTVMQPMRKISSGTRKLARKMSRSTSDNQRPLSAPVQSRPCNDSASVPICSVHRWDGTKTNGYEMDVAVSKVKAEDVNVKNASFQEILITYSDLPKLFEELRETDC